MPGCNMGGMLMLTHAGDPASRHAHRHSKALPRAAELSMPSNLQLKGEEEGRELRRDVKGQLNSSVCAGFER